MILIEYIILFLSVMLYGFIVFTNFKYFKVLTGLVLFLDVFLILQLIQQGLRWHFAFLYLSGLVLTPLLFVLFIKNGSNFHMPFMMVYKITSVVLLLMTLAIFYAFPIPKITAPHGKYAIGTTLYDVTDTSRTETYSNTENTNRKFLIQVWYPSDDVKGKSLAPWLIQGDAITKGFAQLGKLPTFSLNQLSLVQSNAYFDAPMASAAEKYPVIVISHGWSSSRLLHVNMAESLASNGYIVIGIEHTYGSVATAFTDGEISYFSPKTLPSIEYSPEFLENGNKLIKTFAADITYVLDALDDFNKGNQGPKILKGHLDLDKIGLVGHSTGGGAAVLTGIQDDRIKSILAYDPWVEPLKAAEIQTGLHIPTLFLRSDEWQNGTNDDHLLTLVERNTAESTLYQVENSDHSDFTLMYLFTPLTKKLNMLGTIDGDALSNLQGEMDVAFFNHTLLGIQDDSISDLLDKYTFIKKISSH